MKYFFSLILVTTIVLGSCLTDNSVTPLNPNGDSELALLMRQMYEDGMSIKEDIENEKRISTKLKHGDILTAEATEPEKAESDTYKALADSYLDLMDQVNDRKNPHREEAYSNLVSSCLQCHKAMCPGPIVKINKMILE
jgi:hypothetical protein